MRSILRPASPARRTVSTLCECLYKSARPGESLIDVEAEVEARETPVVEATMNTPPTIHTNPPGASTTTCTPSKRNHCPDPNMTQAVNPSACALRVVVGEVCFWFGGLAGQEQQV